MLVLVLLAWQFVSQLLAVFRLPLVAGDDEYVHLDYVAHVAREHRVPVLGVADTYSETRALLYQTYPAPAPQTADQAGLQGESYEAFQPPLYYVTGGVRL